MSYKNNHKSIFRNIFNLQFQNIGKNERDLLLKEQLGNIDFLGLSKIDIKREGKIENDIFKKSIMPGNFNESSVNPDFLEYITDKVLSNKCPLCFRDISNIPSLLDSKNKHLDGTSLLSLPLGLGDSIFGVIHFISQPENIFSREQMNYLLTLGYIISLILIKLGFSELNTYDSDLMNNMENKCKSLMGNEYDLIIEVSTDGTFLYVNEKHEDVLGYRPDELTGLNIFKYIHPDDVPEVIRVFSRGMGALTPEYVKFRYRNKNGIYIWLESIGTPYRIINGSVRAIVASREINTSSEGNT